MSLGDHDTFSMHGCPAPLRREAFALPTVDTRLRIGLDLLGYPVVAGEDAAAAALRHLGTARAESRSLDRLLDEHGGRGPDETMLDAVKRVLAAKDAEIAGLRSDVAERDAGLTDLRKRLASEDDGFAMCRTLVLGRGGFRDGEMIYSALRRLLKKADGEIIERGRRIADHKASAATLSSHLSDVESDLAWEKGRADKLCADHSRQVDGFWTQIADGAIREELLRARAEKAEAEVARLSAPVDADAAAVIDAFHNLRFGQAPDRVAGEAVLDVVAKDLLPELAKRRAADAKPVDVEAAVEEARRNIGLALYDANHGIAGNALCDGYLAAGNAALRKAIADILRSLVRQAPSATAKDEGERLNHIRDALFTEADRLRAAARIAVGEGDDYERAARKSATAAGLVSAIGIVTMLWGIPHP